MFTVFCCARCRRPLRVREYYQGKAVHCPGCAARLIVPPRRRVDSPGSNGSDSEARPEVRAVAAAPPVPTGASSNRSALPWLLLVPMILALGLLLWAGYGILWAGTGVALGAVGLLLAQLGGWSLPIRVSVSLSPAVLGHGLTLAGPLLLMSDTSVSAPAAAPASVMPAAGRRVRSAEPPAGLIPPSPGMLRASRARSFTPELQFTASVGELLALAVVPAAKGSSSVFTTTADGMLKQFDYPDFEWRATYRLEQPAYRVVADGRRSLLWAAVSERHALRVDLFGDRPLGRGDIHAYDLRTLQGGHSGTDGVLRPSRVLSLRGEVHELLIAPDGRALFSLIRTSEGVRAVRLDPERLCPVAAMTLPGQTRALCLTPDGRALYAAGRDCVLVLDPETLAVRRRFEVDADVHALVADDAGHVYLGEQGQWTDLTCLDLSKAEPGVRQWSAGLHGRIYLQLAPDQYRLYVSTSSLISSQLDIWLVHGHEGETPPHVGSAPSDAHGPNRGELFLTPDGEFLVNRWGKVFRLARGVQPAASIAP
jgi:DNA-directed RNA polymerase subunit RPC12/RpoP